MSVSESVYDDQLINSPVAEFAVDADSSPVVLDVNWLLGAEEETEVGEVLLDRVSVPGTRILPPPEAVSIAAFRARDEERFL